MIKVKDLTFRYSGSKYDALKNVSFFLPKGKFIAVLGHNGSGKSTLSKILVGLYKPTLGSISIDGIEITASTLKKMRSKVGIVFQNPDNQFIGATVEDDIAFGLENKKISRDEMRKVIKDISKKVDMNSFLDKSPEHLSGGQKQRVAIASVLALNPDIIIFDEVTSMLDPKGKKDIIQIIKEIKNQKQKTLISITHNMDEAILADEILVFSQGELIASGKPATILNNKKIVDLAKIDAPFIYKLSSKIKKKGVTPTYNQNELVEALCK